MARRSATRLAPAVALLALTVAAPASATRPAATDARRERLRVALAVSQRHADDLIARRDVVGVGAGLDADGEPLIRVLVARSGAADLPTSLDGVRVRTRVSGRLYALRGPTCEASGDTVCQSFERWPLPVPIGVSIGHPSITAGTIGARVTDGVDVFALSNNHVLAAANQAALGDPALQPGSFDGGSVAAGDTVATLQDFEPIHFCNPYPFCNPSNFFDAAVALSSPGELGFATPTGQSGSAPGYGAPNPLIHAAYGDPLVLGDENLNQLLDLPVQKYGRTTGLTASVIDTIGLTAVVCYDDACSLVARFTDQLSIPGAFSAGGDSGSLVVTDDGSAQPVGLLFAGSDNQTIVSRIDRVLGRFGVSIDDGGSSGPLTDAAIESLAAPSFAIVNQTTTVGVLVRNRGTEPLASFDVVLRDETEGVDATLAAPALAPGAEAQLDFAWTPAALGPHAIRATLQLVDDEPDNDEATASVPVLLTAPGLSLRAWTGTVRTDAWTSVQLNVDYANDMVVVCTPLYDVSGLGPMVARVRNASGTGFEVGLGRPWFGAFPGDDGAADVHCLIVRAGVYGQSGGTRIEATRIEAFAGKDDSSSWVGASRAYAQTYVQPVVLGQVISPDDAAAPGEIGVWSTFWARGATPLDPPSGAQLFVGRHTGQDPTLRAPETLAYIVIEAGTGSIDGRRYAAAVGPEVVRGVDDAPPYVYPLSPVFPSVRAAVASPAGMNGVEGGWPILYGVGALQPTELRLAFEEDWWLDPERSHPIEQVSYLVVGHRSGCGLGVELALLLALVAGVRARSKSCASSSPSF